MNKEKKFRPPMNAAQARASKENWTLRILMGAKYSINQELRQNHLPEYVQVSMFAAIGNINIAIQDVKNLSVIRKAQKRSAELCGND